MIRMPNLEFRKDEAEQNVYITYITYVHSSRRSLFIRYRYWTTSCAWKATTETCWCAQIFCCICIAPALHCIRNVELYLFHIPYIWRSIKKTFTLNLNQTIMSESVSSTQVKVSFTATTLCHANRLDLFIHCYFCEILAYLRRPTRWAEKA